MFKVLIVLVLLLVSLVGIKYKFTDTTPSGKSSTIKPASFSIVQPTQTPSKQSTKLPNQTEQLSTTKQQTNKPARRVTFAKKSLRRDITPEGKFIEYKLDVKK